MWVEQVAARQWNPQNWLDDVADGAVVRETDLFCSVHEMATTGGKNELHELQATTL